MGTYMGHEAITVAGSAVGVTAATADFATHALLTVEDAQIRFTVDGTTPTSTVGHLADPGDTIELEGRDEIRKFRAIRVGASAVVKASYAVTGSRGGA